MIGALACSGAFLVAGASQLLFRNVAFFSVLLVLYLALAGIGIAIRIRRRGSSRGDIVYFLNAFATESLIVTDLEVTTSEVAWSAMQIVHWADDFLVLRRRRRTQYLVVRQDMFVDEQRRRQFLALVDRKLNVAPG